MKALYLARFIACMHVLVLHYGWKRTEPALIQGMLSHGEIGPSFFIVLSGYTLARLYNNETHWPGFKTFLWRRFARVYPLYFLSGILIIPFKAVQWCDVAFFTATQQWAEVCNQWRNAPAWAVSHEIFFYVAVFPLLREFMQRQRNPRFVAFFGLALSYGAAVMLALFFYLWNPNSWWKFFPLVRVPQFAFGFFLAVCAPVIPNVARNYKRILAWTPLLSYIVLLGFLAIQDVSSFSGVYPFHVVGLLEPWYGFIIWQLSHIDDSHPIYCSRVAVVLGKLSYAAYILQTPLYWIIGSAMGGGWLFIGLIVSEAFVVLRFVEEPVRAFLLHRPRVIENVLIL